MSKGFNEKFVSAAFCAVIVFIALCLTTTIAVLLWFILTPIDSENRTNFTCPPNPCLSTTSTSASTLFSSTRTSPSSSSMTPTTISTKRTYKESCEQWNDCNTEHGLLCEFGWKDSRSCLCEGSHYWSNQQQKCLRKGEINDTCTIDYQCHREIGLVCDQPTGSTGKICICAADIYWAKESDCGQITINHIVDCIDEHHATTCLVLGSNNLYHLVTIRSLTETELSFDWFLIDNRILLDLPQLSCAYNNETKYCFGLSIENAQHSLKLAQFIRKGFHSVETIGGTNRGIAFGLTNVNSVAVFARNSQNTLYRRIIADDEILSAHEISTAVTSDPTCYIHEVSSNRQIFCFARNAANGLSEFTEISANSWRTTQLGSSVDRIRDETAPVCNYIGSTHRYCFAVLENGQIYRILAKTNSWSSWQMIDRTGRYQFKTSPVIFTSRSLNYTGSNQSCYLIAIDTTNHLQMSTNSDCAQTDNFSDWISLFSDIQFKQFDKVFHLRDGNLGLFGINIENQPIYVYFDWKTNHFTPPRRALTMKSEQFRP